WRHLCRPCTQNHKLLMTSSITRWAVCLTCLISNPVWFSAGRVPAVRPEYRLQQSAAVAADVFPTDFLADRASGCSEPATLKCRLLLFCPVYTAAEADPATAAQRSAQPV